MGLHSLLEAPSNLRVEVSNGSIGSIAMSTKGVVLLSDDGLQSRSRRVRLGLNGLHKKVSRDNSSITRLSGELGLNWVAARWGGSLSGGERSGSGFSSNAALGVLLALAGTTRDFGVSWH